MSYTPGDEVIILEDKYGHPEVEVGTVATVANKLLTTTKKVFGRQRHPISLVIPYSAENLALLRTHCDGINSEFTRHYAEVARLTNAMNVAWDAMKEKE